jgi:hypothetical protein
MIGVFLAGGMLGFLCLEGEGQTNGEGKNGQCAHGMTSGLKGSGENLVKRVAGSGPERLT